MSYLFIQKTDKFVIKKTLLECANTTKSKATSSTYKSIAIL